MLSSAPSNVESAAPDGGTVFGFRLHTSFRLFTGRNGPGDRLVVEESPGVPPGTGNAVMTWTPSELNPISARLYADGGGGYTLEIDGSGRYRIDPAESTITIPPEPNPILRENRLLGLPLLLCFLRRGELPLHAAAVEVHGRAILLAAPGRHGKTSLAASFVKLGHRLLTEDLSCVRPGDAPQLVPGPAGLRIRGDMASLIPLRGMSEVGPVDDRRLFATDEPGDCRPVPIMAIVLVKDLADRLYLTKTDPVRALPDLWALSLHLPGPDDRARKFAQLVDLSQAVPVWDLIQPLGPERLPDTARSIIERIGA